jgi:hypothetical protein
MPARKANGIESFLVFHDVERTAANPGAKNVMNRQIKRQFEQLRTLGPRGDHRNFLYCLQIRDQVGARDSHPLGVPVVPEVNIT